MKARFFVTMAVLGIGFILGSSAFAKSSSTEEFVHKASVSNQFTIESSKIAIDRGKSDDVKNFAQRMIDDHTRVGDQLLEASKSAKMKPTKTLDSEHQKMVDELKSMPDNNFDNRYIGMQIMAHEKSVQLFSTYSENGSDPELKSFAAEILPTLKEHLKEAQQLKSGR